MQQEPDTLPVLFMQATSNASRSGVITFHNGSGSVAFASAPGKARYICDHIAPTHNMASHLEEPISPCDSVMGRHIIDVAAELHADQYTILRFTGPRTGRQDCESMACQAFWHMACSTRSTTQQPSGTCGRTSTRSPKACPGISLPQLPFCVFRPIEGSSWACSCLCEEHLRPRAYSDV